MDLNPNGNGRMFANTIEASFRFVEGSDICLWFRIGGNYTALTLWNESKAITCENRSILKSPTPTNSEFFYLYGYAFENDIGWSWG